jgi:hypothetical protein
VGRRRHGPRTDMHFRDVAIRARLLKKKKEKKCNPPDQTALICSGRLCFSIDLPHLLAYIAVALCFLYTEYEMGSRSSKSESVGSRPSSDPANHKKNPSLQNKNNPNQALTEEQPSMFLSSLRWMSLTTPVVNTGTTLYSLQGMQHHDHYGRPISMYFHCSPESRAN